MGSHYLQDQMGFAQADDVDSNFNQQSGDEELSPLLEEVADARDPISNGLAVAGHEHLRIPILSSAQDQLSTNLAADKNGREDNRRDYQDRSDHCNRQGSAL